MAHPDAMVPNAALTRAGAERAEPGWNSRSTAHLGSSQQERELVAPLPPDPPPHAGQRCAATTTLENTAPAAASSTARCGQGQGQGRAGAGARAGVGPARAGLSQAPLGPDGRTERPGKTMPSPLGAVALPGRGERGEDPQCSLPCAGGPAWQGGRAGQRVCRGPAQPSKYSQHPRLILRTLMVLPAVPEAHPAGQRERALAGDGPLVFRASEVGRWVGGWVGGWVGAHVELCSYARWMGAHAELCS